MSRIAAVLLMTLVFGACSCDDDDDDDDGAGAGGGSGMNAGASGMNAGASGMSSGGGSGASGGSGGGSGESGASGMSGMGGSGGGGAPSGGGQVVAPWDELCVLTFTEDYDVLDFGDTVFTAKSGDSYLMASGSLSGTAILYLTPDGQVEFELEDDAQFTTNCEDSSSQHAAVFADTIVYADEELTMELCTLEAGTHASGSVGYAIAGDDIFTSSTYEVTFTGLESFCDGMSEGFVEGVSITIGSGTYTQIALATVLAP